MCALAVPAVADDNSSCTTENGDARIAACTRVISNGGSDLSWAYRNRGLSFYAKEDYDRALADYNQALRIKPNFKAAFENRGYTYLAKNDYDRAIADYSEAIKLDSKDASPFNNRGRAYFAKQEYDRALADYNEAARINPVDQYVYNNRGRTYAAKKDYDHAIADYNEAIRLNPKEMFAYNNRGLVYAAKQDYDRAIADYNEAIRLNANDPYAYVSRGMAYNAKKDYDRAIADYTQALRVNPKNQFAYNNRGNVFYSKGDYSSSIADLTRAIDIDPLYSAAFTNRGLSYEKMKDIASARSDYYAALAIPAKYDNGQWALDKAKERLADLPSTSAAPPPPVSKPVAVLPSIPPSVVSSSNDRRVALVIGNSGYKNVPVLPNPERDAATVADALRRTGFTSVTLLTNLTRDGLLTALRNFAQAAESADWSVVYYAGHGMEVGGTNYLIPIDARIASDRDIGFEAVPLEQVLNAAERAKKLRLVILDACRDNPFANQMKRSLSVASRSVSRGLAAVEPDAGTLVVYAAKDGETALDGDGGNSPFAAAFVKNLQTPGLEVRRLFDFVRDDVMDVTQRRQKPFSYGSISGRQDFYFVASK